MKITLALTIYKQTLNEVSRWFTYLSDLKQFNLEKLQILILCDNPNLPQYYSETAKEYGLEIVMPSKNLGRTGLIKTNIDNGLITGDYLNLLDPDDYFNIEEFIKVYNIVTEQSELVLNIHDVSIYKNMMRTPDVEFKKERIKIEKWKHPVNFNSFYIVEDIKNQRQELHFSLCDDLYWFSISCSKGRKLFFLDGLKPYIWSEYNGDSNAGFNKSGRRFKIYKDFSKYDEQMNFLIESSKIKNIEKNTFILGEWVIMSLQNNLISSEKVGKHFSFNALFKMKKMMKYMKLIYNGKRDLDSKYLFEIYWKTFRGKKI